MKIILTIENIKRKNVYFVTENFKILSLEEAIKATQNAEIENVHVVNGKSGPYLRSHPNTNKKDNLDSLTIGYSQLIKGIEHLKVIKNKAALEYIKARGAYYEKLYPKSDLIYIEEVAFGLKSEVFSEVKNISNNIMQAAKQFDIDQYLLAGIIIDEVCRKSLDDSLDFLGWFGANTSVGIAQVKINTAKDIIKAGYFPDLNEVSDKKLYLHLIKSQNNIKFAAARVKQIIEHWESSDVDIKNQPGVIGQLYSQGLGSPKVDPRVERRGNQISTEFYHYAKEILSQ